MAGCSTLKKDQKNLATLQLRNPELFAQACAEKFPVKATGSSYSPGKNVDYSDSLASLNNKAFDLQVANERLSLAYQKALTAANNDSACQSIIMGMKEAMDAQAAELNRYKKMVEDLKRAYKPCVPDTIRDTIPDLAAIRLRDLQISSLQGDLGKSKDAQISSEKSENRWRNIAFTCFAVIGIGVLAKIKGFI